MGDLLTAVDLASGVQSNVAGTLTSNAGQTPSTVSAGGALVLQSSTGADLSISGKADILKALKLTTATGAGNVTVSAARTTSSATLSSFISSGSTLNVDGHVISFKDGPTPGASSLGSTQGVSGNVVTDGNGNSTVYLQGSTIADALKAVDFATGVQTFTLNGSGGGTLATAAGQTASSINASGQLNLSTGVNADLSITGTGNALQTLGLAGNTGTSTAFTAARTSGTGGINAGNKLCHDLDLPWGIVTLDRDGMALVDRDRPRRNLPTQPRAVYDITGAGRHRAGHDRPLFRRRSFRQDACRLGNAAGGLEVEKIGVAVVPRDEVRARLLADRPTGTRNKSPSKSC